VNQQIERSRPKSDLNGQGMLLSKQINQINQKGPAQRNGRNNQKQFAYYES